MSCEVCGLLSMQIAVKGEMEEQAFHYLTEVNACNV